MDSWSIEHLAKGIEHRGEEDWQASYGVPIPHRIICSVPNKNPIALDHCIVKNRPFLSVDTVYTKTLVGVVDWHRCMGITGKRINREGDGEDRYWG